MALQRQRFLAWKTQAQSSKQASPGASAPDFNHGLHQDIGVRQRRWNLCVGVLPKGLARWWDPKIEVSEKIWEHVNPKSIQYYSSSFKQKQLPKFLHVQAYLFQVHGSLSMLSKVNIPAKIGEPRGTPQKAGCLAQNHQPKWALSKACSCGIAQIKVIHHQYTCFNCNSHM